MESQPAREAAAGELVARAELWPAWMQPGEPTAGVRSAGCAFWLLLEGFLNSYRGVQGGREGSGDAGHTCIGNTWRNQCYCDLLHTCAESRWWALHHRGAV